LAMGSSKSAAAAVDAPSDCMPAGTLTVSQESSGCRRTCCCTREASPQPAPSRPLGADLSAHPRQLACARQALCGLIACACCQSCGSQSGRECKCSHLAK
jgi:hypothetical protein